MASRIRSGLLTGCLLVAGFAGCGGPKKESVTPPPPTPAKALLSDVATTGELGSGASSIRDALTAMKATDGAKADELLKDLDELETMSDQTKLKAKAKAMADKL